MKEFFGHACIIGGIFSLTLMIITYVNKGILFDDGMPDIFWLPIYTIMFGTIYQFFYWQHHKPNPQERTDTYESK